MKDFRDNLIDFIFLTFVAALFTEGIIAIIYGVITGEFVSTGIMWGLTVSLQVTLLVVLLLLSITEQQKEKEAKQKQQVGDALCQVKNFDGDYNQQPHFGVGDATAPVPSPIPEQLFCTNCGKLVSKQAVACMSCGTRPIGYKKFCLHCGVALNPEQIVCIKCGVSLTDIRNAGIHNVAAAPIKTLNLYLTVSCTSVAICLLLLLFLANFIAASRSKLDFYLNAVQSEVTNTVTNLRIFTDSGEQIRRRTKFMFRKPVFNDKEIETERNELMRRIQLFREQPETLWAEVNSYTSNVALFVFIIGIIEIVGGIFGLMLQYQSWKLIPTDIARTTPGKAIGFCFIPFFNLYWIFVAFNGLSKDMNKTLQSRGIQYQVDDGLGLAFCILFALCIFLGYVNIYLGIFLSIASGIAWISFLKSVKDGAVALLEQKESC